MQHFQNLRVWRKAHRCALDIYRVTRSFPAAEKYGLISQLRRGATSVRANIAEGCGRYSKVDKAHFLQVALGSASELKYHLIMARDLELLADGTYARLFRFATDVKRMLTGLIRRLR